MTYWNPGSVPQVKLPNQNWYSTGSGSGYTQQYQNMAFPQVANAYAAPLLQGVNAENRGLDAALASERVGTTLSNQLLDLNAQNTARDRGLAAQIARNNLAGIPDEKAWRNRLKNLAEQTYNVDVGQANLKLHEAQTSYKQSLADLYSDVASRGITGGSYGARGKRGTLQTQLAEAGQQASLERRGAGINLQTAYANYTHYIQQLDIDAKNYGLTAQQAEAGANAALQEAGLHKQVNLQQLYTDAASNDAKKSANAREAIGTVLGWAAAHPEAFRVTPPPRPSPAPRGGATGPFVRRY